MASDGTGRRRMRCDPIRSPWKCQLGLPCTHLMSERAAKHMGGCQNYGPFLGTLNIRCRIIMGIQKDHDFDNHPHVETQHATK